MLIYGKRTSNGQQKALECTDDGLLKVDAETFISDEMKTLAGAAQTVTIPAGARHVVVDAKDGAINVKINGTATDNNGFYIPTNSTKIIALGGATSLSVYGAATTYAYFNFYE